MALLTLAMACKNDPKTNPNAVQHKRNDNSVVVRMEAEPDRINPLLSTSNYARQVFELVHQYLLIYDPFTLEFIPQLAKSEPAIVPITSGPLSGGATYTFEILDEARWDDGSPVTGKDYLFTLKAIFNPLVPTPALRSYLSNIRDIQVDPANPKRFTVFIDEQTILGIEAIANAVPILPAYLYDPQGLLQDVAYADLADTEKAEKMAETDPRLQQFADAFADEKYSREAAFVKGSGPYEFLEWETGQRIVLRKKANWWGNKLSTKRPGLEAYPDSLIFKPIPNPATALAALKNEEVDVMQNITPADFLELKTDALVADHYNLFTPASLVCYFISVNATLPKLADKRVRQALAHAINVDEIIQNIYEGFGQRSANPVHPSSEEYNQDLKPVPFNIDRAKTLLREAGWEDTNNNGIVDKVLNGQRTELSIRYLTNASRETSINTGLLIKDNAAKAGIDIQIDAKDPTVLLSMLRAKDFELVSAGRTLTPTWNPKQTWHTQGDNRTGFGNAQTDALIDKILVTTDARARRPLVMELQKIIYDEQVEIILFNPQDRIAAHKRFEVGTSPFFPGYFVNYFKLANQ